MPTKRSWREKLADDNGLPEVGPANDRVSRKWGQGIMVIPAPREVDAVMRRVPRGKLVTMNEVREALARQHEADFTCPLTTGIFAWIAAHAAEEGQEAGETDTTPYWRTLKNGGELNPKYPGGIDGLRIKLESEGHRVIQKGKRFLVDGYERALLKGDLD